jgi:hypothetical protein
MIRTRDEKQSKDTMKDSKETMFFKNGNKS